MILNSSHSIAIVMCYAITQRFILAEAEIAAVNNLNAGVYLLLVEGKVLKIEKE